LFCCRASAQCGAESVMSRCARISQKTHSVALRCLMSENALQFLKTGVDRLLWEVENLPSSTNSNGHDICQSLESWLLQCCKDSRNILDHSGINSNEHHTSQRYESVLEERNKQKMQWWKIRYSSIFIFLLCQCTPSVPVYKSCSYP
jgi:hypothetical protein